MRPEVEAEDVSLPRQEVVADVHPPHRRQVTADDAVGDEMGERGGLVVAALDLVQRGGADRQPRLVLLVPLGDARVQVPAVVVEARAIGDCPDLGERLVFELAEPDGDVGHLHAGVVDVVLDLDLAPEEPQQPAECVAERRVAEVPDVRRLVRVDRRMLDDGLGVRRLSSAAVVLPQPSQGECRPVEEEIDVSAGRCFDPGELLDRAERGGNLLRDRARRLAQAARQLEGERDGKVPQGARRRDRDGDGQQCGVIGSDAIEAPDGLGHTGANELMNGKNHRSSILRSAIFSDTIRA